MKNNKTKILHVVGGMNIGGTETMLMNLYRKVYKNIQFDFISYYDKSGYYDDEIMRLGGNIIKLEPPNKVGIFRAVKDLKNIIKINGDYAAVHTHTLFNCGIGVLAAYISGIKIRIAHAHTTSDSNETMIKKIYISLMRIIIRLFSTKYLSCSDNAGKYLFGDSVVNNKKYEKLPNYIDYERFINSNSGNIRKELGLCEDDIVVGHIGRFIKAKNHKFIIEVVAKMVQKNDKVKCILVGNGDLYNEIRKNVNELGLDGKIYFLGIRDDIENIVNDLDLFILPSIYEGLGLVLLEAQAAGVPCLVSEAVQPEADLNIGLVKHLRLSDSVNIWSDKAMEMVSINKVDKKEIISSFIEQGYSIENIVDRLERIYGLNRNEEIISI